VAQFRQPHNLFARFREICDTVLPGLTDRLLTAGCVWVDYLSPLPPTISDRAARPGDERLRFVTGRRPTVEAVVAAAARELPGISIRRGVEVVGLTTGPSALPGVPHVAGLRLADGTELPADLVVDATGRRTPSAGWLDAVGARAPYVESEDRGFVYYTRYFTGPDRPQRRGRALDPMGSVSVLTLDGDNDTWSVTLFGPTRDAPLKALREPEVFDRVIRACPRQAHWLDGRPLTGVLAMAGIVDRYRRFVVDGTPVVTGFAAVGDAWCCTNPSTGRGLSVGMVQAQVLRRVVGSCLDDPAGFARAWDEGTEREATPFYRAQVESDRARFAEMDAIRQGLPPPPPDAATLRFLTAAMADADVYRALMELVCCLATPAEVFARPGLRELVARKGSGEPPRSPALSRAQLLELLDA
jgi:2-polyprenyl-6-methoxyphenol hydroxylase-like FAD-dependent oxidoreductase